MIEICAVGGYREIGKNCTAVKVDDEVVILDLGLQIEKYVSFTQDEEIVEISGKKLIEIEAAPDISVIEDWKDKVKAICISHAHLDHLGAIPFLGNKFNAPIHGTPYTIEVLKIILADEKRELKNELIIHDTNSVFNVSEHIKIEFINMTHSTPQTVMIAIHTRYGTILYANDFKFDNFPVLGNPPNFKRLKKIKPKALIVDSLYANKSIKTPSERVAREMLRDVLIGTNSKNKAVVVTTFSSHLARLKSIIDFGEQLNRKIVFLGRSLAKYVQAGENIGIVKFSNKVKFVKYGEQARKFFKKVKKPGEYLFVVTGHQAEPKAMLSKMVYKKYFDFLEGDFVIFSCTTIPTEINIKNIENLENELRARHVRLFKDIHVSGHAAREDHRDLINMINPEHIIPAHGDFKRCVALAELAHELGYEKDKVHILQNGQRLKI